MAKQMHKERLAKQREWRANNKVRVKAYSCSYHRLHAEEGRVFFRKWSAAHLRVKRASDKARYLANREDILVKARFRYAKNRVAILIKARDKHMRSKVEK